MSFNYTLKYRTFEQLLDAVRIDFTAYDLTNYIEPQQLIKVAKRVSYDLGLRIMMTKEAVLEVKKGSVRLPNDFYALNYALVCDSVTVFTPVSQGTDIQEVKTIPPYYQTPAVISPCTDGTVNCQSCGVPCNTCQCQHNPSNCPPLSADQSYCAKPRLSLTCKGDTYELVQVVKGQTRTYNRLWPLRLLANNQTIACDCPNLYVKSAENAWIQGDFLYTNMETANVYISYQGQLEDQNGDLLVPDHDLINDYYEYAIKQRILENLIMNDEPVGQKLNIVEQRLRVSRVNAKSIVNTPNFAEMKEMWWQNRRAQYGKYYEMFKSYPWYQGGGIPPLTYPTNVEGQMNRY
jgi:hypothetical protein